MVLEATPTAPDSLFKKRSLGLSQILQPSPGAALPSLTPYSCWWVTLGWSPSVWIHRYREGTVARGGKDSEVGHVPMASQMTLTLQRPRLVCELGLSMG